MHRDVKPANVLLADSGQVLLVDFGIAVHPADTTLTSVGVVLGAAQYAAPERLRGTDGLPASDLFSVGVTLYEAVEGVSPFKRDTLPAALTAVLLEEAPEPQHAGELAELITGLLVKDPAQRLDLAHARNLLEASAVTRPLPTKKLPPAEIPNPPEPEVRKSPQPAARTCADDEGRVSGSPYVEANGAGYLIFCLAAK